MDSARESVFSASAGAEIGDVVGFEKNRDAETVTAFFERGLAETVDGETDAAVGFDHKERRHVCDLVGVARRVRAGVEKGRDGDTEALVELTGIARVILRDGDQIRGSG